MKRWIHISFQWPGEGRIDKLETVLNKAADWFKYSRNCYFVFTGRELDVWRDRIADIPGMEDKNIIVLEFDRENLSGYLPDWMWKQFKKPRQ